MDKMDKTINICRCGSCDDCPFYDSCGLGFDTKASAQDWLDLISDRIDKLERLQKKIQKIIDNE